MEKNVKGEREMGKDDEEWRWRRKKEQKVQNRGGEEKGKARKISEEQRKVTVLKSVCGASKTGGQKSKKMRREKQRQKVKLMKSKENKGKYLKSSEKEGSQSSDSQSRKKVKAGQSNERKNQNSDKNEKEGEGVEIKKENP